MVEASKSPTVTSKQMEDGKARARARSRRTRDSGSSRASPKGEGAPLGTLDLTWTSAPELSSSRSAPPGKIHQGQ